MVMKTTSSLTIALRWVILGILLGAGLAWWWQQERMQSLLQQQQHWQQLQEQWQQTQLHNQSLQTQLTLEQATQDSLEQRLAQKQLELSKFQEQLAFYEHLLPLSGSGSIQVRALELQPQAHALHYQLLLQRSAALPRFNGHIQFTAHGQQGEDSVNIVLMTVGEDPSTTANIEFEQFLRTSGLLQIPADLQLKAITLHIYQGKQLRATHTIDLVPNSAAAENN